VNPNRSERFGRVEIQPAQRRVLVDGQAKPLGARAFDMLLVLMERRDRIVAKNELLDLVWPGMVVEENNLPVHVSALRKLLGADAIATIPGRGYRFTLVATLEADPANTATTATTENIANTAAQPQRPSHGLTASQAASTVPAGATSGASAIARHVDHGGDAQLTSRPAPAAGRFDQPGDAEPIIGREEEVYDIVALLVEHRLVDIVGAGGMGKTRLARAVMRRLREDFVDGVWWVDLAPLTQAYAVVPAIAQALGESLGDPVLERPGESLGAADAGDVADAADAANAAKATYTAAWLARTLAPRSRLLLVLDNCEQVAAGVAPVVAALLQALPLLRIVLTSRTPMHLAAEQVWRLEALQLPAAGANLAEARACGAFELFETRARACDRRFAIDAAQLPLAIELCRRLEGHALSIEMAAARVPQFGLAPMLDRLGERLRMLRSHDHLQPPRQQTLRATLDWSCSLLDATQRTVLRRIAVLAGWFDLETAQHAAADAAVIDTWAVLDALSVLVDHSLVQVSITGDDEPLVESDPGQPPDRQGAGTPRYRLAETTRLYALEQLAQASERE
jgi:predicted ATPase/DNA-binding winged helix-turn-helix (wHTH) protein